MNQSISRRLAALEQSTKESEPCKSVISYPGDNGKDIEETVLTSGHSITIRCVSKHCADMVKWVLAGGFPKEEYAQ